MLAWYITILLIIFYTKFTFNFCIWNCSSLSLEDHYSQNIVHICIKSYIQFLLQGISFVEFQVWWNIAFHGALTMICVLSRTPADIWCENDVGSTSMRRHHVASTLIRRHFGTKCPLGHHWNYYGNLKAQLDINEIMLKGP